MAGIWLVLLVLCTWGGTAKECLTNITTASHTEAVERSTGRSTKLFASSNVGAALLHELVPLLQGNADDVGRTCKAPLQRLCLPSGANQHVTILLQNFSDDEIELKYQYEIMEVPTILMVKNSQVYAFSGNNTTDSVLQFVKKGFKKVAPQPLGPPKGTLGKLTFTVLGNIESFVRTMDHLGLDFLPRPFKLLLTLGFLLSPILAVLLCIWLTQEPEVPLADERKGEGAKAENKKTQEQKPEEKTLEAPSSKPKTDYPSCTALFGASHVLMCQRLVFTL